LKFSGENIPFFKPIDFEIFKYTCNLLLYQEFINYRNGVGIDAVCQFDPNEKYSLIPTKFKSMFKDPKNGNKCTCFMQKKVIKKK
jgi:hypothetical protein